MTTTVTKPDWLPTKPASEYDDAELQTTPLFQRMLEYGGLSAEEVLPIARTALTAMWNRQRTKRFAEPIAAIFALLDAAKENVGDSVVLNRDGSFRPAKKAAASAAEGGRMKPEDYAQFIGKGNNHPKAKHGGFVLEVTQSKQVSRNGEYELVIGPGIPDNKVCTLFTAKLYQRPSNGAPLPVISYPPAKGERKEHRANQNLVQNEKVFEVPSMSGMMKQSILANPQTPGVTFGLTKLLRAASGAAAAESDEEDVEDGDEDAEGGNTAAVLGSDDEEFDADE